MGGVLTAVGVARISVISVVAATLAAVSPAALAQTGSYGDVPQDAYYTTPVADLAAAGVFAGTDCDEGFCPGDAIDRKTMAVWTVRVLDGEEPPAVTESRFDDVDADGFYAPFIERMAELGVTSGCGDGSGFCPDHTVTRAQMAVFLSRGYELPDGPDPGFSDVASDAWYAADVARVAASGITVGCGDGSMFCPGGATTRGQMATFLWRAENPGWAAVADGSDESLALNAAMSGGGVIAGACAISSEGSLVCWGSGEEVVRDGTYKAVNIDSEFHWCAIRSDDTVECWSGGALGALGAPPGDFLAVTSAEMLDYAAEDQYPEIYSCGIRADGTLTCWQSLEDGGYSDAPECEEFEHGGRTFTVCSPQILQPPEGMFKAISRACAIAVDGTVECWSPYYDFDDVEIHGPPPGGGTFKALSLGRSHSCAIRTDDTLTCWGDSNDGKLDAPDGQYMAVSSGVTYSCAIRTDGTLACWGNNDFGQLDAPSGEFIAVSVANVSSCAIGNDNAITCWGLSYDPDLVDPLQPPDGKFGPVTTAAGS